MKKYEKIHLILAFYLAICSQAQSAFCFHYESYFLGAFWILISAGAWLFIFIQFKSHK